MPRRILTISIACLALALPASAGAAARRDTAAVQTLHRAQSVARGHGVRSGFELTPLLKQLAVDLPALRGAHHAYARRLMERPTLGATQPGEDGYTVPEAPGSPYCSPHFCVHWVATTRDAPPLGSSDGDGIPDYVQTMSRVFEHVYEVENGQMGWRAPKSDGTRGGGGEGKTDVYVKELGDQGIFGYSTPDPGQSGNSQSAYLVMDNDYNHAEYPRYTDPVPPMEVTAAHEYNHVLQFGYDVLQDTWMLESTAVWMEDRVYDDVNDYVSYLRPWVQLTQVPLTRFNNGDPSDSLNVKVYGDGVWNRWIDAHYGPDAIRGAWERSLQTSPPSFGPAAYDASLRAHGTTFFDAFTRFAVDTAEWRSAAGPFEEGSTWPDVQRSSRRAFTPGSGTNGHLDHTSYVLFNVVPTRDARIKFVGTLPKHVAGAVALVGRTGPEDGGTIDVQMRRVTRGGRVTVTLDNPSAYARITAVLVNADVAQDGFSQVAGDWDFTRDGSAVKALVSNDFVPPRVNARSPGPGRGGVSRTASVAIRFSERMVGLTGRNVVLVGPHGRHVSARVKATNGGSGVRLTPRRRLARRTTYQVRLRSGVVDRGDNGLPAAARTWRFRTGG